MAKKPKIKPKPQTASKPSPSSLFGGEASDDIGAAGMGTDDIMKYIQQQQQSSKDDDDDLDLFSWQQSSSYAVIVC